MTTVQLQKIEHAFGSRQLFRGLNLNIASGEYLVLLGQSGCGKTTLLRAIAGLLHPDGGSIRLDNKLISHLPPRQRDLAFVFQQDALYPHLTIRDSIRFSLRSESGSGAIAQRIDHAAKLTGIENLLDCYPEKLSGGERRRCSLAKALASGHRLRLLDEPLSALDAPLRFALQEDIVRWHQIAGGTTIHVTHDGYEAMRMADRIAVLDQGQIVQCDRPETLFAKPRTSGVARAIGVWPMQWLRGTIRGKRLRLDSKLARCPAELELPDGPVDIGFRPEDVRVERMAAGSGDEIALPDFSNDREQTIQCVGRIADRRCLESRVHLRIEFDGRMLLAVVAQASSDSEMHSGQAVCVRIPVASLHLFRCDDGSRMEIGEAT